MVSSFIVVCRKQHPRVGLETPENAGPSSRGCRTPGPQQNQKTLLYFHTLCCAFHRRTGTQTAAELHKHRTMKEWLRTVDNVGWVWKHAASTASEILSLYILERLSLGQPQQQQAPLPQQPSSQTQGGRLTNAPLRRSQRSCQPKRKTTEYSQEAGVFLASTITTEAATWWLYNTTHPHASGTTFPTPKF